MRLDNQLIHGDCIDILQAVPNESFDFILTSPPYDNLRSYKGYKFPFEKIAEQLVRVLKPGRVIVWVVSDATIQGSETGTSFRQALSFMELGLNLHDTMIFRKRNPIPQIYRKRYRNEFEYMFVLSKGKVEVHNPIMIECKHAGLKLDNTTYKNYSRGEQRRGKQASPVKEQKIAGNVWEYVVGKRAEDQEAKGHPAPFPLALARDHIDSWSNKGDLVFDPMCGSGTTCKAAKQLGRKYFGIEISDEYLKIAKNRLAEPSAMSLALD